MNTQELRNKIDNILGNSMRVLLPSYWWKRLFHHVADVLDSKGQGVSIVESEKDLKKLDVPEGSIASVVGDAEWKSFDECFQPPEGAGDEYLPLCTRIPIVNVSDAPITIVGSPLMILGDISSINTSPRVMYLAIDNKGVSAMILRNPTGSVEIEGLFNLRSADSTVVNKVALNKLNSALSSGRFLFVGYEADSSDIETEEEQIAALNSIFSWAENAGGVFCKGLNWNRLAMANEIPDISGSTGGGTNITVDSSLSTTSTNPVQNKVVTNALNNKQTTLVSGTNIKTINGTSILGSGDLKIDMLGAIVSRDLYAVGLKYGQTGGVITELTSEMKDYNKVTKQLFLEGKADVRIVYVRDGIVETFPVWHYFNYYDSFYFVEPFDHVSSSTRLQMEIHRVRVEDDGTATWERYRIAPDKEVIADSYNAVSGKAVKAYVDGKIAEIPVVTVDSELSDTSENPIQNKVIKKYVDESIATSITNALNTEV